VEFNPGMQGWFNLISQHQLTSHIILTEGKTKTHDHLKRGRKACDKIQSHDKDTCKLEIGIFLTKGIL
jgi:hypothetical protein